MLIDNYIGLSKLQTVITLQVMYISYKNVLYPVCSNSKAQEPPQVFGQSRQQLTVGDIPFP